MRKYYHPEYQKSWRENHPGYKKQWGENHPGYFQRNNEKNSMRIAKLSYEARQNLILEAIENGIYIVDKEGNIFSCRKELGKLKHTMLKEGMSKGYLVFKFCYKGVSFTVPSSRFIWNYFKGPIPKGMQVDHFNEIKTDNRISNLQLLTRSQNLKKSHFLKSKPYKKKNKGEMAKGAK